MKKTLEQLGNAAAIFGIVLCFVSGLTRVAGFYYLAGFELITLFEGGMGLMLGACLAKVHVLGMAES